MLVGVMLLSSGASALNQVQERSQDARMARTAGRPIPSGRLSTPQGLAFAALGIGAGAVILWIGAGRGAGILGLIAAAFYNGVYTPWLKPTSPFAAVPGAVPGAALPPPLVAAAKVADGGPRLGGAPVDGIERAREPMHEAPVTPKPCHLFRVIPRELERRRQRAPGEEVDLPREGRRTVLAQLGIFGVGEDRHQDDPGIPQHGDHSVGGLPLVAADRRQSGVVERVALLMAARRTDDPAA